MTGVGGLEFLLDLPEATMLRGGDGSRLEDGRTVEVVAEPERLAEIRAADPLALTRVAWRLGNRHLATEILPKALRIRRDPAIEAMAEGLGARVIALEAPFNPEGGAYAKAKGDAENSHHAIITTTGATIITTMSMAGEADGAASPLLIWLSPTFPVGAFAYSHRLPRIQDLAREARMGDLADLGGCAFRTDIAAVCQGTRSSRLFRS